MSGGVEAGFGRFAANTSFMGAFTVTPSNDIKALPEPIALLKLLKA